MLTQIFSNPNLSTMISLMTKRFFFLFLLLSIHVCYAQDVRYYKLTRIQQNVSANRNVSGGQFITFSGNMCFESNNKGLSIGNGTLKRNNSYSNAQYTVYQGSSYWGNSSTFKFNADKSVLNVVLDNGDIYVYKRTSPPTGVTTCSLIRRSSSGSGSQSIEYTPAQTPYMPQPSIQPQPSQPTGQSETQPRYVEKTYICTYCHGKGTVVDYDNSIVDYTGNKKYCNECGQYVPMNHIHKRCPSCHGKGTYTKMEQAY